MLSHVDELCLSRDGRIPPDRLALAQARDAAARAARPKSHARVGAIRWKPHTIVARMPDAMRRAAGSWGACGRDDLLAAGFTPREIERYREEAAAEAARLTARRVAA